MMSNSSTPAFPFQQREKPTRRTGRGLAGLAGGLLLGGGVLAGNVATARGAVGGLTRGPRDPPGGLGAKIGPGSQAEHPPKVPNQCIHSPLLYNGDVLI